MKFGTFELWDLDGIFGLAALIAETLGDPGMRLISFYVRLVSFFGRQRHTIFVLFCPTKCVAICNSRSRTLMKQGEKRQSEEKEEEASTTSDLTCGEISPWKQGGITFIFLLYHPSQHIPWNMGCSPGCLSCLNIWLHYSWKMFLCLVPVRYSMTCQK